MMHVHFLDPYHQRDSLIHRLDPRIKLVLTIAFILTNTLLPTGAWPVYILLLAIVLSAELASELGIGFVIKRSALAMPFVLATIPLIFTISGKVIFNLSIGPWTLAATYPGVERFLSITIKSWLSIQAAILLAATTSFPDLLVAMRALHVPRMLVSIFGLMWRYLFVLIDEATRLMRARTARSGQVDQPGAKAGNTFQWRAKVTGGMAGSLFLRAFERSDRIYMAMLARGYDGEARSLPLERLNPGEWIVLVSILSIFGLLLAFAVLFWG